MPLNFGTTPGGTGGQNLGLTQLPQYSNPWSPAAGQDFGANPTLNRALAEGVGYTGSFGGGQYQDWLANNPGMRKASNAIIADYRAGGLGSQDLGRQTDVNRALSNTFGYTGDFGSGQWDAWSQANLTPAQRDLARQISQSGGPNSLANQTMNLWGDAADLLGQIVGQRPDRLADTDLAPYMNPYTQDVIDRTMAEMNRQHEIQRNIMGDTAQAASAYGGDRFGVMEAEMNRNFADQQQNWLANMLHTNFGQAQQGAKYDISNQFRDIQNMLAAAQGMGNISNLGFGMGGQLFDQTTQAGLQQMGMQQALMDHAMQQYGGVAGWPSQMVGMMGQSLPGYGGGQPYNQNMQLASAALQAIGPEFARWAFS